MARTTRRAVRRGGTRNRRKLIWVRASQTGLAVPGTTPGPNTPQVLDALSEFRTTMGLTANLPGCTIMRIRGIVIALPGDTTVPSTMRLGAKIDNQAEGTGGAEPGEGPVTSNLDDWFMYEPFAYQGAAGDTRANFAGQVPALTRMIDVRAKRRLDEVQRTLLIVAQAGHAPTWTLTFHFSILVALP